MKIPVSEYMCEKRTDKILAALNGIKKDVSDTKTGFKQHRAWHNGMEEAEEKQRKRENKKTSKSRATAGWIGLAVTILLAISGMVWFMASMMTKMEQVVQSNNRPPPVVDYGYDIGPAEEDP
jgi:cell division septal protein FtsQ